MSLSAAQAPTAGPEGEDSCEAIRIAPRKRPRRLRPPASAVVFLRQVGWKAALLGVGFFLVLPFLAMTTQATSGGRALDSQVVWSDFQSYLSRNLAITLAEVDVLARGAWGAVPHPQAPLSVQQARLVEDVLNKTEEEKIRFLVPNAPDGPLSWARLENGPTPAGDGRFQDVSLDHPVYVAWKNLLKLGLKLATGNGQARPYESIRWDEWNAVIEQLGRLSGTEDRPLGGGRPDRQGEMQNADLQRALLELRGVFGIPVAATHESFSSLGLPTRLEAFGALAALLNELEQHDPNAHP